MASLPAVVWVLSAYKLLIVLSYLHLFDFVFSGGCFNDFAVISGLLIVLFICCCGLIVGWICAVFWILEWLLVVDLGCWMWFDGGLVV